MNGMQQARVAGIAAGSITLLASGPAHSEPALVLLGAMAGLVLLFGVDRLTRPRVALAGGASTPSSGATRQSAVFLRDRAADSTDGAGRDPVSKNGRRADEDEPAEEADDDDHDHSLSYEEFTARVAKDEDTEEISFLPPYASGAEEATRAAGGAANEPWDLDDSEDAEGAAARPRSKMPMPRHFALGTVAVIRKLLEPESVERILTEQRRYPRLRFGDIAVQLGLLTESQLQEVLLAQQQGVFTDAEIREARNRMRAFREQGDAAGRR